MRCYPFTIILFLAFGSFTAKGQTNSPISILEFNDFVMYKSDTFNLKDENGLIQGPGIDYSRSVRIIQFVSDRECSTCLFNDTAIFRFSNLHFGSYENDKKVGAWHSFYENGNLHAQSMYDPVFGLISAKIFYESGEVSLSGPIKIEDDLYLFKNYTKSGMLIDTYWFILEDLGLLVSLTYGFSYPIIPKENSVRNLSSGAWFDAVQFVVE